MSTTTQGLQFTEDDYSNLLSELISAGYDFVGYDEPGTREVILRHDVDLCPVRALKMARIEAALGISSTYFFLVGAAPYDLLLPENRKAIEEIRTLGHDVGLHFDVRRYWDDEPATDDLVRQIESEAASLGRLTGGDPVPVVSFHVPPRWVLGVDLPVFTNAYAPRYFEDITYRSDSNQKWRDGAPFVDGPPETMQILVHPGLWHERDRTLDCILDEYRDGRYATVDGYFDLLGR